MGVVGARKKAGNLVRAFAGDVWHFCRWRPFNLQQSRTIVATVGVEVIEVPRPVEGVPIEYPEVQHQPDRLVEVVCLNRTEPTLSVNLHGRIPYAPSNSDPT